jgi:hypothetical protein
MLVIQTHKISVFHKKKLRFSLAGKIELTLHDLPEIFPEKSLSDGRLGDIFQQALF